MESLSDSCSIKSDLLFAFKISISRSFLDNSIWNLGSIPPVEGKEAIVGLWVQAMSGFPFVAQLIHNGTVEVDGDKATGRWYIVEHLQFPEKDEEGNPTGMFNIGVYQDKYIKINGFTSGLIPSTVLGMSSYYDARYTIEFRFKDNKFKVDIIDFETYTPPSQYVAGGWMDRVMKFKVETRKGKPYKDGVANLARFTEHFDNLIKDATEYNNSTEDSKDFDF